MARKRRESMNAQGVYALWRYDTELMMEVPVYVGSSVDLMRRSRQHYNELKNGTHENAEVQALHDGGAKLTWRSIMHWPTGTHETAFLRNVEEQVMQMFDTMGIDLLNYRKPGA